MSNHRDPITYRDKKGKGKGKADLSDTGLIADQPSGRGDGPMEDSFQRLYSKELDLDEGKHSFLLIRA